MAKIRVGIFGASGYTGGELLRILLGHPQVELAFASSRSLAGQPIADELPHLRGRTRDRFRSLDESLNCPCELVFFATPSGTAMELAPKLLGRGLRVVDLSADYRLRDQALWQAHYGRAHASPELLPEAVYGLTEFNRRQLPKARLVANPGCYPTAVLLGLAPLLKEGLVDASALIADAKSGVSGAGANPCGQLLYGSVVDKIAAYKVGEHRHVPEMLQALRELMPSEADRAALDLTFVPHIVPAFRGMEATLYLRPAASSAGVDWRRPYENLYAKEAFIDIMELGRFPDSRSVRGSNLCRIGLRQVSDQRVVVSSVIDNLVKGAAGQAVQNMNLMFGFSETQGLDALPFNP